MGKNLTEKEKPMLRFMLMLLAQWSMYLWSMYYLASATKHNFEFGVFWHDISFFLTLGGEYFLFRADFDLAHGQFLFFPKGYIVCTEVLFPIWKFIDHRTHKYLLLQIYCGVSQSPPSEFIMDLPLLKNAELDCKPRVHPLSFLLQRKVL